MKKNYIILFWLFLSIAFTSYGQKKEQVKKQKEVTYLGEKLKIEPKTTNELKNTALIYKYEIDTLNIYYNRKKDPTDKNIDLFEKAITDQNVDLNKVFELRNKLQHQLLYNNKMLNILFGDEVATYVNGGSDLSLNKYYAGLDADDSSITFSMNFNPREETKLKPLRWLFSIGFKAKADEKFATIFKNGKFDNNDLGITGKVTLIGKGIININPGIWQPQSIIANQQLLDIKSIVLRENIIKDYRKSVLLKYEEKIKNYIANDFPKEKDSLSIVYNKTNNTKSDLKEKTEEFIESKYEDFYEKIANEEIQFMKKNKLYRFLWNHWGSIDFFAPIGQKKYNISTSNTDPNFKSINFYPLKITGTYTNLLKFSDGQSIYLTGQLSIFNNNNIKTDDISTIAFQTISSQSPTQQSITDSKDVYVIANGYNNFVTGAVKVEVVYFFFNWLGISPAAEKNFGQHYHPFNWKIGLPISLKDKEGKPNVNLEAQFKKVNEIDIYGISISFLLGKFLN